MNNQTIPEVRRLSTDDHREIEIAVLIPCLNEEKTIAKVVADFSNELPEARIYVFDNNSTDRTTFEAETAGATVLPERRRGKGRVVQAMFQKIDADIYIMVDGDDTYPAKKVKELIAPVLNDQADMTVGSRISEQSSSEFRRINYIGNKMYLWVINGIFGTQLTDILSGYRCMNRKFVKNIPLFLPGFEVETELTIKSLERGFRILEVPINLKARPAGSYSKIRIVSDGIKILGTIFSLFRDYKPLTFFGSIGLLLILLGLYPGIVAFSGYLQTGLMQHIPAAILSVGMDIVAFLSITVGIILHTIDRRFQELEYLYRNRD